VELNLIEELKVHNDIATPLSKQLADNIRCSISTGSIKPGEKLPPLRELSKKLNLSINTVRMGYKMLEEQLLIVTRPHYGTQIVDFPGKIASDNENSENDTTKTMSKAVLSLVGAGMTITEIKVLFEKVCERIDNYNNSVRVLYVECSEYECSMEANQISQELGIQVDHVLIDQLKSSIDQNKINLENYKTVITSYFHYSNVIQAVKPSKIPVLGMVIDIPSETVNYILDMPSGQTIGILCEPEHSLQYLINVIKGKRKDVKILTAFSTDGPEKLKSLIDNSDALFVTPSVKQNLSETIESKQVFLFVDHVNSQSIEMLRQYIQSEC